MKIKSLKLSDYFEIKKPTYTYFKLTPDSSIRNYNSSAIAKSISLMYKNIFQHIKNENKRKIFETNFKVSYFINITKKEVTFYFIVPNFYKDLIKEKIRNTWKRITIDEVDAIEEFKGDSIKYQLYYKKEDALSLAVDKKNNDPLNSLLNVIEIIKEDERIGIFYNFIPTFQGDWRGSYKKTISKLESGKPVERDITGSTIIRNIVSFISDILREALGVILGNETKENSNLSFLEAAMGIVKNFNLSNATEKKKNALILKGQIIVESESKDRVRAATNAITVCQSFKAIEEDNELKYKEIKNDRKNVWYTTDFKIKGVEESKFSIDECSNFIQLPGRELQDRFGGIKKINTLETEVPNELQQGTKCIGDNTFKGNVTKTYLTTDKDYKNLALVPIGPTRSGKTTLLGNLAADSVKCGECVIVLDYIENCGLSEDIKAMIPKENVFEVNLYDTNNLQGLGYNEAIVDTDDVFRKYESAKKQASQVLALINSINISNSEFTPRMERYLTSACLVSFIQKKSLRDVIKLLQEWQFREDIINTIPKNQNDNLEEYIGYLKELDEWSKATKDNPSEKIGTKTSLISGVVDRFNKLKSNTYMELMLKKDITDNFNLLEEMEKNQVIFIKMPEVMFGTAEERDIMTTYWLTKIWMAAQARAWKIPDRYKRKTVTVIGDEIAQLKSAEEYIGNRLDQTAKFGIKFVLSTMYINQLRIREKLKTANTSYMFISGSDKSNFKELKDEFEHSGYTLEDMLNLKRYHSLNYIKHSEGYWAGITELPKPN